MARNARPRPGSAIWTARTSGSSRASLSAIAQVASVLPLSAIVIRALNGKLSRRKPASRRTLGARSRSSLRTGTTMSTWGTLMAVRIGDHARWRLKPSYVRSMSKAGPERSAAAWLLLARAPPGGAATDRSVPHLGAAPRAAAAGAPGRDNVAGVHPAPGDGGRPPSAVGQRAGQTVLARVAVTATV